jgi:DGQHR domain-containing protein
MNTPSLIEEDFRIDLPCIRVSQPIGDFFVTSMPANILRQITFADVRQMQAREVDTYLGIQREVSPKRVKEIGHYVNTVDACFPTAVIVAVDGRCAEFDPARNILTLKSAAASDDGGLRINKLEIARVLDGQHRIEGLQHLSGGTQFDVNVSVFIDMDIENQAYLFSVVNLAQTKVQRSLAYDLFDYSQSRSPQKTAHNVSVALDRDESSPLYQKIKRLGVATKGRFTETLTQATVVESLLPYLSADPVRDRDSFLRRQKPKHATAEELRKQIFRNMFLEEKDLEIAEVVFNFFSAVRDRWGKAWTNMGDGAMLSKTNGFRAMMRVLRPAYLHCTTPGGVVSKDDFARLLASAKIDDAEFNTETFKPGTSGESALFHRLVAEMKLERSLK